MTEPTHIVEHYFEGGPHDGKHMLAHDQDNLIHPVGVDGITQDARYVRTGLRVFTFWPPGTWRPGVKPLPTLDEGARDDEVRPIELDNLVIEHPAIDEHLRLAQTTEAVGQPPELEIELDDEDEPEWSEEDERRMQESTCSLYIEARGLACNGKPIIFAARTPVSNDMMADIPAVSSYVGTRLMKTVAEGYTKGHAFAAFDEATRQMQGAMSELFADHPAALKVQKALEALREVDLGPRP